MRQKLRRFAYVLGALALPWQAHATLGGAPFAAGVSAAVDARVASYRPGLTIQGFKVAVVQLGNGTVVQEWLDSQGRVFAVRWSGPDLPDMGMLLGTYLPVFTSSVQAARQAGKRGGPVVVQAQGLALVSTGAMGVFRGYAYLEALAPSGADLPALLK